METCSGIPVVIKARESRRKACSWEVVLSPLPKPKTLGGWLLKACARCSGDMCYGNLDEYEMGYKCVQCSSEKALTT